MARPLPRKLQIFVSSTYVDLRAERQAAVTAILENGHIPAGMELFAAGNEEQLQVIRRWIDESDIFLLILGRRYGSIEPKSGTSYIELEYEHARTSGKPFFAIVLNEDFISTKIRRGQSVDEVTEKAHPEKFKAFYESVTSRLCKFVEDEKDIRLAVAQSIRDLERRHEFVGWVSGRDAVSDSAVAADLGKAAQLAAALQERNAVLEKEVKRLSGSLGERGQYEGRTFEELHRILKADEVTISYQGKTHNSDLPTLARHFRADLARGVSNSAHSSELETALYFQVASRLLSYGLAEHARVPSSVHWQRIVLSQAGKRFLNELEARIVSGEGSIPMPERTPAGPVAASAGSDSAPPVKTGAPKKQTKGKK